MVMFVIFALFAACTMMVAYGSLNSLNDIISPSALLTPSLALSTESQNVCFQMYTGLLGVREYSCINGGTITNLTTESVGIIPFSDGETRRSQSNIVSVNQCFADSTKFPDTQSCTDTRLNPAFVSDWNAQCFGLPSCNFDLSQYFYSLQDNPEISSSCANEQARFFMQFTCQLTPKQLHRGRAAIYTNVAMMGLIVVVFYLEFFFVWNKIWKLSFERFKERVNPALFTVKSHIPDKMWFSALDTYRADSDKSELTHFLCELKQQLRQALQKQRGLAEEETEIVTMVCELDNDHKRIDFLEKRA